MHLQQTENYQKLLTPSHNSNSQQRLDRLALLSIENEEARKKDTEKVINDFANKNARHSKILMSMNFLILYCDSINVVFRFKQIISEHVKCQCQIL